MCILRQFLQAASGRGLERKFSLVEQLMQSLDSEKILRPAESVRTMHDASGDVLLDLKQGICYGMNPIGTRIWELLELGTSFDQIVVQITAQFRMPEQQIRDDAGEFVAMLEDKGLLRESDRPSKSEPGSRRRKGLIRSWLATTS